MHQKKLVLAIAFLMLLLVLTVSLATNADAATGPTRSTSSDFYNLEKTCAVINVYLHGTQSPTATCAQTKAMGVSPKTEVRPCSAPGITMEIQYNSEVSGCLPVILPVQTRLSFQFQPLIMYTYLCTC